MNNVLMYPLFIRLEIGLSPRYFGGNNYKSKHKVFSFLAWLFLYKDDHQTTFKLSGLWFGNVNLRDVYPHLRHADATIYKFANKCYIARQSFILLVLLTGPFSNSGSVFHLNLFEYLDAIRGNCMKVSLSSNAHINTVMNMANFIQFSSEWSPFHHTFH